MSSFLDAFNSGNRAFGNSCGEPFEVVSSGRLGNPGTYQADNIDDLAAASALVPGGRIADITNTLFIPVTVIQQAGIVEGTILAFRGYQVRVLKIHNEGDDSNQVDCKDISGMNKL
jgi:hypothetical protein